MNMNYKELEDTSIRVKNAYDKLNKQKGERKWSYLEYAQGLVGDMGDLMKMLMAKANLRGYKGDLDDDIKHEISDCLWSLIIISNELGIDLPNEFHSQMNELADRVEAKLK